MKAAAPIKASAFEKGCRINVRNKNMMDHLLLATNARMPINRALQRIFSVAT